MSPSPFPAGRPSRRRGDPPRRSRRRSPPPRARGTPPRSRRRRARAAGAKTTTQRENGSGRRKRSHEFRNLGRLEDEDDGRTSAFPCSARTRIPRLQRARRAARSVGREGAAGCVLQGVEELGGRRGRRRATTSRARRLKPQNFRNVAMISPSSLLRSHRDVALAAVREDPADHPLVPDRVERLLPLRADRLPVLLADDREAQRQPVDGDREEDEDAENRGSTWERLSFRPHAPRRGRPLPLVRDAEIIGPLSFQLENGRVLGVAGENGSGKTTLLSVLAGLIRPSGGPQDLLRR